MSVIFGIRAPFQGLGSYFSSFPGRCPGLAHLAPLGLHSKGKSQTAVRYLLQIKITLRHPSSWSWEVAETTNHKQ